MIPRLLVLGSLLGLVSCSTAPRNPAEQERPVPRNGQPGWPSPSARPAGPRAAPATSPVQPSTSLLLKTGGQIENKAIKESSGLARSQRRSDVLWTVNDSGGGPLLFAIGTDGSDLGVWKVTGARARDWEDLSSCLIGGVPHLIIADVGDNLRSQSECILVAVPEPVVRPGGGYGSGSLAPTWTSRFRYADGPRDCEALAFDSAQGVIYLVDKQKAPPTGLYSLPGNGSGTARRLGSIVPPDPLGGASFTGLLKGALLGNQITAMDFDPKGKKAALLTYGRAWIYDRAPGASWVAAFQTTPRAIPLNGLRQAEAIAFASDGALYATSEGVGGPLVRIEH